MKWQEIPEALRDEMIDESVEESVIDYGNTVLFSSARNEYMITRIKRLIRTSVWGADKADRKRRLSSKRVRDAVRKRED